MKFSFEDDIFLDPPEVPKIPLPAGWTNYTLMTVLHVIALARIIIMNAANWPDDKACDGLRLRCENDRLRSEVALLQKELKIKDARFSRLEPRKRPTYTPSERFEILLIRSIRGMSNLQLARRFQVTVQTVQNWLRRAESGEETVQMPIQPTRYPDFVRYLVQQFKACCPMLGRFKIAEMLARAGLHLSASTVRRIVKEPPASPVEEELLPPNEPDNSRSVTAKYPNHTVNVDLTVVPISDGFWIPWSPFTLSQCHPYAWHILVDIDHISRKVLGFELFKKNPTSGHVTSALDQIFTKHGNPKYLISDRGSQFDSQHFCDCCKEAGIKNRYGAIGKHGSIALTERVIRTFKEGCSRRILVPVSRKKMEEETRLFFEWYNEYRPHTSLNGRTPNEVFFHWRAKNTLPRIETRPLVSHSTPCASPRMIIAGKAGARVKARIEYLGGRSHLPVLHVERI